MFCDELDEVSNPPVQNTSIVPSASAKLATQLKGRKVIFNMTDYVEQSIQHYKTLSGVSKLRDAQTPFCPEGSLRFEDDEAHGELASSSCSILMKVLWAARLARPDLSRPCSKLTCNVQSWSKNDDKKLRRLVEYMQRTKNFVLEGFVCDPPDDIELWMFVDADLASDPETSKSSSGAWLVLVGPSTFIPISWLFTKQTSTAKSTTEAESVALVTALLQEAYPILDLLEKLFGRPVTLRIKEDNTATIKVLRKGYSSKLRHVSRTHKLDLGIVKEAIDVQKVNLEHVETTKQCADIFTKDLPPHAWPHALNLLGMRPLDFEGEAIACPLQAKLAGDVKDLLEQKEHPLAIKCGGLTACAIIDQVVATISLGEALSPPDDQASDMIYASAHIVKAAVASKASCKRARPSGKLPGWGKLIEVCTDKNSNLGNAAKAFTSVKVIRITAGIDFSDRETVQQVSDLIEQNPGVSMHGSLPCTDWSTWQEMNVHKYGATYLHDLTRRRNVSIQMIKTFVRLSERVLTLGGQVSFEWPSSCRGWLILELLAFITKWNLMSATVDGCSLGMCDSDGYPILKRWRFVTTCVRMYQALSRFVCTHPSNYKHSEIHGSLTPKTAFYPMKLCTTMLTALFGWYEFSPAMPCVAVTTTGHQPREVESHVPAECHLAPQSEGISLLTKGLVHQLLSWKETRSDPLAVQAVRDEVNALAEVGTWDESSACSRDHLIKWAQSSGTKIHVGEGLGICSIKNSELPESDPRRKYKGRFCYRTPTCKDEGGAIAIFQEMASRPTTIVALNLAIAYGLFHGHKTTVADAIKAYVQSYLVPNPKDPVLTFLELPRHLCPDKYKHLDRPCFRLLRALYGHPEAGGHWEQHLTKIILSLGGAPIKGHPSCFWIAPTKLFLIVYVDDLLLSGPSEAHKGFWDKLSKEVNIEPPENIDRYLGRHHSYEDMNRLDVDLIKEFTSPVKV